MKGLFINNKKAQDSIYESGLMAYKCLLLSNKYQLDYIEIEKENRTIPTGYDFYFFNFHFQTMKWLNTSKLKKELNYVITLVLEVDRNDPFVFCPSNHFHAYCVLDPTIKKSGVKVYPFPRPLEEINFKLQIVEHDIPVIGTFGFATRGKGFHHVVEAVNKEFEKAVVRINIPYGDFVPDSKEYAAFLGDLCIQKAKKGIDVSVTHNFMSKEELIKWCAYNTLNCFLYDRNMPGLSATTDQAIVSGKPLSVSANDTFRHITAYLKPYPQMSLKESIEKSAVFVKKMQQDWKPEKFANQFEILLTENANQINKKIFENIKEYTLPLKGNDSLTDILKKRVKKYYRKLKKLNFSTKQNVKVI
jgi:hypothetical protein